MCVKGEKKSSPIKNADYMFNSSLTYELGILRNTLKLLLECPKTTSHTWSPTLLNAGPCEGHPRCLVPFNS